MLKSADPARYTPAPGANYPRGRFGDRRRFRLILRPAVVSLRHCQGSSCAMTKRKG
jgi:hypothetical protein